MSPNEHQISLAQYRLQTARECLTAARILLADSQFRSSANRSYYAIFHSMRSVLALDGLDFKKHSAVLGKFRELHIKNNDFDIRCSDIAGNAFDVRNRSDYEDFYLVSKEDTQQQV